MNILILPSWYPNCENTISGIFVKHQVEALAKLYPEHKFSVIYCHKRDFKKSPFNWSIKKTFEFGKINEIIIYHGYLGKLEKLWAYPFIKFRNYLIKRCVKQIAKNYGQFDLIHAHVTYPAGFDAYILAKQLKIPYLITEHMGPFPFNIKFFIKDNKLTPLIATPLRNASKVIAVSNALAKRITYFGYKLPVVIPNLIKKEDFNVPAKTNQIFTFISIATLTYQKGFDLLIKAVKTILTQRPLLKFKLIIGGDGDYRQKLQALVEEARLENIIKFLGYLEHHEVLNKIAIANVFVLPSRGETFGVVYTEAISLGIPIIATKCGGPEDIVNPINGLLCNMEDPDDLADKMLFMIDNYSKYNSSLIKQDFTNRFSEQSIAKKIINVYSEILEK